MRGIVVALSLATAGCVTKPAGPVVPIALTERDVATIKERITFDLKDPASANFSAMLATRAADGAVTVCGNVNAKNGFGGYVGYQPFIGTLKPDRAFDIRLMGANDADLNASVTRLCEAHELPVAELR